MSVTPEGLQALIIDQFTGLRNFIADRLPSAASPAPSPPGPPGTTASEQVAAFKAKWSRLDAAAFLTKYGVALGQPLPPTGNNPAKVREYAAQGYDYLGRFMTTGAEPWLAQALDDIAHELPTYYTGYGACEKDVCAVAALTLLVLPFAKWREFCTGPNPAQYAGQAFDDVVRDLVASGGAGTFGG